MSKNPISITFRIFDLQKNLRNVRLVCQPGYCLLVGGKKPDPIKIYAIIETSTLKCVDKSEEYYITVKNTN